MLFENFSQMIGNTPIIKYGRMNGATIFIKLEGCNPTGSLKDRTAHAILKDCQKERKPDSEETRDETKILEKGKTILDATSGSFGCSITFMAKLLNFPVLVVANKKLTPSNRKYIKFYNGEIFDYGEVTRHCYEYCTKVLIPENPGKFCFLDQLNNPLAPLAHFQGTAPEIHHDLPEVDAVAVSMGSGATMLGIAKYFQEHKPEVKIIASTAKSGRKIAGTFHSGQDLETPFIKEAKEKGWPHFTGATSWDEAVTNVHKLKKKGIFVGPQTGGVFTAVQQAIDQGISGNIVIVSGDTAWKNVDKLMNNY